MLALCSMLSGTYCAHNYASIIGESLLYCAMDSMLTQQLYTGHNIMLVTLFPDPFDLRGGAYLLEIIRTLLGKDLVIYPFHICSDNFFHMLIIH